MVGNSRQPEHPALFQDPQRIMTNLSNAVKDEALSEAQAQALERGASAKRMPNYLQVTEKRAEKKGIINLKPYFARSPHKKYSKDGHWYMSIPIRKKTRNMSRKLYDNLRSKPMSPKSSKTVVTPYLYDRRQQSPSSGNLNYTPKSNNVTMKSNKDNTRRSYTMFRTVSANSPANSWIINRNTANEDDMSKTLLKNIDRLMKWKLKNIG